MIPRPSRQSGFTLLWLLFFVATLGVGMAALGTLWHSASQREKERELLFAGDQYRRALESYSRAARPGEARLPKKLDDLLLDPRFPHTVRHLRRFYPDPITGNNEWGLPRDEQGGITGIHSLSDQAPIKIAGFPVAYAEFEGKTEYRQWVYLAAVKPEPAKDAAAQSGTADNQENQGNAGNQSGVGEQPAQTEPPIRTRSETQLFRLACLAEKERASADCVSLQGQAQSNCHTQVFQRYRACLSGS